MGEPLDDLFAQTHGGATAAPKPITTTGVLSGSEAERKRRYGALMQMLMSVPPKPQAKPEPRRPTMSMSAADIVPDALVSDWSRKNPDGNPQNAEIFRDPRWADEGGSGEGYGAFSPMANYIAVDANAPEQGYRHSNPHEEILPHEVGHAMWPDLPPFIQKQWETIHKQQLAHSGEMAPVQGQPGLMRARPVNRAFGMYRDDPSHSWAEMVGEFVGSPEKLQQSDPYIYNWMRSVFGREFKRRTPDEAGVTTKVPFNRDAQ